MNEPLPGMDPFPITSPSQYICPQHDLPIQFVCQKHSQYICKDCLYDHANHVSHLISIIPSNQYKYPRFPTIEPSYQHPKLITVNPPL